MRYVVAALVVVLVVGGLAAIKWSQIATMIAFAQDAARQGAPAEAVGTTVAEEQVWERTLDAVGTVASGRDVAVRNEVPGVVSRIAFQSGQTVREGDILVELESQVERAELEQALAAEQLARVTYGRTERLVQTGAAARVELDRAEADLEGAGARVAQLRAVIAKKVIRAPYSGRLGIRDIQLGAYLETGTLLTAIRGDARVYVDFPLPQQRLADVAVGMPVRVRLGERALDGTISALEPTVDPSTRAVGLRAVVTDTDDVLRPGMFVGVSVVLPDRRPTVVVPATAIVHAAYGDSVFLVEDRAPDAPGPRETRDGHPIRAARQSFVRTGARRGDFVEIVEGLEPGREVVSTGAFKLRNGSPVYATTVGAPSPELEPRPEER